MQLSFTPDEIAAIVQPRAARGATTAIIRGISALGAARPGDLSFLGNPRYKTEVAATRASVVLVSPDYAGAPGPDQLLLVVDQPSVALARVCARLEPLLFPLPPPGVHPTAVVASGAKIAATAVIGPHCVIEEGARVGERTYLQAAVFIGRNAVLGDDCRLMAGVRLCAGCLLGHRVCVHANAVIGSDGFGYEFVSGRHEKVSQIGIVAVEDDVEIGAGTTIDRARFGTTRVGEGTKIDNLVQIGHNATIGKHCILCGQAGVSGSAAIGDYVVLGGQVGVTGHIRIGRGSKVGGKSGVAFDLPEGSTVSGNPAIPLMLDRRIAVLQKRLPDLFRRVDALEAQIKKHAAAYPPPSPDRAARTGRAI